MGGGGESKRKVCFVHVLFCSFLQKVSAAARRTLFFGEMRCSNNVVFNVGGTRFEVARSTVTAHPDTLLANMIKRNLDENELFIDADSGLFRWILQWYRRGLMPSLQTVGVNAEMWSAELSFYGLLENWDANEETTVLQSWFLGAFDYMMSNSVSEFQFSFGKDVDFPLIRYPTSIIMDPPPTKEIMERIIKEFPLFCRIRRCSVSVQETKNPSRVQLIPACYIAKRGSIETTVTVLFTRDNEKPPHHVRGEIPNNFVMPNHAVGYVPRSQKPSMAALY